jgi:tetratricopeptide (TPR) repeat protein
VPLGAAGWLDRNLPGARVWCDLSSSSNLHWYTRPHREMPILSNTWAYPPAVMRESRRYRAVLESFETAVRRHGIQAVVLRTDWSQPLYMELVTHPDWELVHVEGLHAVLALARGPRSTIVRRAASALRREEPQQLLERLAVTDPFPDTALFASGTALNLAGLYDHAIALFDHVVARQPSNAEAWQRLASGYSARGKARRAAGRADAQADLEQAERCYRRADELRGGLPEAG